MKYELNEQIKVTLDERLLLVEADTDNVDFDALGKEVLEKLDKYNDNFKNTLLDIANNEAADSKAQKAYNNNAEYKALKTAEETAKQAIEHGALDKVQAPVSDYTEAVRDIVRKTNGTGNGNPLSSVPNLSRNLDLLDALAEKLTDPNISNVDKQQIVLDLSNRFNELTSQIKKALDEGAPKRTPQSEAQKKLEEDVEELFDHIQSTKASIRKRISSKDQKEKNTKRLIRLNNKVQASAIEAKANAAKQATDAKQKEIAINQLDEAVRAFDIACLEYLKSNEKKDFEQAFADAGDDTDKIDAIWKQYYDSLGQGKANYVKNLGEAFTKELLNLGFYEDSNPFLSFINYAFDNKFPLNYNNYPAIHNAYVRRYISDEDLRKISPSARANKNLLFCPALYNDSAINILTKLELQDNILTSDFTDRTGQLKTTYPTINDAPDLAVAIFTDRIPIEELAVKKSTGNYQAGTVLRPIARTKKAYDACFGSGKSNEAKKVDKLKVSENIAKLAKAIKDENLQRVAPSIIAARNDNGDGKLLKIAMDANGGVLATYGASELRKMAQILRPYGVFNEGALKELIKALS